MGRYYRTSASGAGGKGFKSWADQISNTLLTTRHRCNLVWALAQSRGDGHRLLVTPERVLSEYKEDLIFSFNHSKLEFAYRPIFKRSNISR